MEGPDLNCPADKWSVLVPDGPTDPVEWAMWNREGDRQKLIARQQGRLKGIVIHLLKGRSHTVRDRLLDYLVAARFIEPEIAAEISIEMGGVKN